MKWAIRIVWGLNALLWPFAGVQAYRFMMTLDDPVEIRFPVEKEAEITFPKPQDTGPTFGYTKGSVSIIMNNNMVMQRAYGHSGYIENHPATVFNANPEEWDKGNVVPLEPR